MPPVLPVLLLAALVSATPPWSAAANPTTAAEGDRDALLGCWSRETLDSPQLRACRVHRLTYCFRRDGRIEGWDLRGCHGADFELRWRPSGLREVALLDSDEDGGQEIERCADRLSPARDEMTLTGCAAAGEWRRDPP